MQPLTSAILKTLSYADVFDFPLTIEEIHRFLISNKPVEPGQVEAEIEQLIGKGITSQDKGMVYLQGRESLIAQRRLRQKISQRKQARVETLAKKLGHFPWLLGLWVTGNVSMENADEQDDIDVLVVTRASRLWVTRMVLTTLLDMARVRRKPDDNTKQVQDQFCLNMYIDELSLAVPEAKRNLYTAHEVVQVMPVLNKQQVFERFLHQNQWVADYLPQTQFPPITKVDESAKLDSTTPLFEQWAYQLQRGYMNSKMTRETISPHMAYFHPRDTSKAIMKQYQQRCIRYGIKTAKA